MIRGGSDGTSELVPSQLVYKDVKTHAPRYKYVKILLSNILNNQFVPTATGVTQIQFKMPYNTVYNLAKSKLAYQINIPAQGSGVYTWVYQDCFNLGNQLITFETGNGLQLLNLPEPMKFSAIIGKVNQKFTDYVTNDGTEKPYSNAVYSGVGTLQGSGNLTANPTCQGVAQSVPYLEPQYMLCSALNTAVQDNNYYPLGRFAHTILALDKDIYAGQNDLYLKITTGGYNQMCFQGTSATNPTTSATSLTNAPTGIQNVYLYLAVQQDPMIIDRLVNQFNSAGIKLTIDYPIITKTTTQSSTNQQIVIPFVPANGKFLKKVYHTVWNATESLGTLLDCGNVNASKIVSYNTYLDSTKLQDDVINCAQSSGGTIYYDDWRTNEIQCRNSPIFTQFIYQKNWFHCDDFTQPDLIKDPQPVPSQNLVDGIPMERGIQWQFLATTTNASYIHDNFAIFVREVLFSPNGIQFV